MHLASRRYFNGKLIFGNKRVRWIDQKRVLHCLGIIQGVAIFPNGFQWERLIRRILAVSSWTLNALLVNATVMK
jgi:hypothetical protein